jgi:PAS domain S-box-containing protein
VNPAWTRILGWNPEELLGHPPIELVHPEDRERLLAEVRNLALRAETVGVEARLRTKGGTYRWIRWSATAVPEERLMYNWGRDVTAEIKAEERLRRQDAQLENAQAIAHLGSWEWDFATRRTTCSDELFRIFGLEPGSSPPPDGELLFERVHPSDREAVRTAASMALESATPFSLECRILRADGVDRIVHLRGRFVADPIGRDRMMGTIQDVTEWRRAEENLRESEERFRRIFEEGPMGVAIVNPSLRILQVNDAFAEMLGYAQSDLRGRSLPEITHPEDVGLAADLARKTLAGELPRYDIEKRFVRRDGDVVWGRVRVTVVRGAQDTPLHGFVLVEDITEAREAERIRRDLDAMKDGFVRVVSHDLQGPLATIAGLAELLSRRAGAPQPDQSEILRRIATQSERLRIMVATFLDMDRLYQGGVRAVRQPTYLAALVEGVMKTFEGTGHPLSVQVDPFVADVDAGQLEHILGNLLGNAFTHTEPGTPVWLRVAVEGEAVSVVVEDAGPGVPDDLKEPVFELFRTGGATGRTGIGLWSVARFAELHGGRAWVEDRTGGGARFRVLLPTADDS